MLHTMAEKGIGLAIASEPNKISKDHPCWYADKGNSVAATWRETGDLPLFNKLEKGYGFIAVKWGKLVVVGVYIPPKLLIAQYEKRLDRITSCIRRYRSHPVLVVGDFNAHSQLWGCEKTDHWGNAVVEWMAENSPDILNRGQESTFVGAKGSSIIDLSFVTT